MNEIRICSIAKSQIAMIQEWWLDHAEAEIPAGFFPLNSTWIAEIDGVPALSVSLYLTNADVCYVENFIGNPTSVGPARREATERLLAYITRKASEFGYTRMVCLAPNEKLREYYKKIGFTETGTGLTSLVKET